MDLNNSNNGMSSDSSEHKKVGPIIAMLVIVLVLIIVALYLFASKVNNQQFPVENTTATSSMSEATETAAVNQAISIQPIINTADDVQSLQNDLNKSIDGLDSQSF